MNQRGECLNYKCFLRHRTSCSIWKNFGPYWPTCVPATGVFHASPTRKTSESVLFLPQCRRSAEDMVADEMNRRLNSWARAADMFQWEERDQKMWHRRTCLPPALLRHPIPWYLITFICWCLIHAGLCVDHDSWLKAPGCGPCPTARPGSALGQGPRPGKKPDHSCGGIPYTENEKQLPIVRFPSIENEISFKF